MPMRMGHLRLFSKISALSYLYQDGNLIRLVCRLQTFCQCSLIQFILNKFLKHMNKVFNSEKKNTRAGKRCVI